MMRSHRFIALGVVVLLAGLSFFLVNNQHQSGSDNLIPKLEGEVVVTLTPDGYEPERFTVPVGTTVTFKSVIGKPHWPASNLHPTHSIYSEFDPLRPLEPAEEWSFRFDKVGAWNFHDHIRANYTGTIYVEE